MDYSSAHTARNGSRYQCLRITALRVPVECRSWSRVLLAFLLFCCLCVINLHASRALVDDTGRTVTVPDRAQRIICLAPSVTDDVFSMGAGPQVVAVSNFTRYPAEAAKKTSIGSPATPSLEQVLALHPDVVVGTVGINRPETVRLLEQHGITVYMVKTVGLAGVYQSLQRIGDALGRQKEAAALVAKLRSREIALRTQSSRRPAIRVFLPLWYDPVFTIGKTAYMADLLAVVGLHSVTDDIAQEWPKVSLEAVIARDPDMLVLLGDDANARLDKLSTMPGWSTLRAVRERKALHVDNRLELPSPVCFDALDELAQQLVPR